MPPTPTCSSPAHDPLRAASCSCADGILWDQTYGTTNGPPHPAVPVQRCDQCGRFPDDEAAAREAADRILYHYQPGLPAPVFDDAVAGDEPGDWWVAVPPGVALDDLAGLR